MQVPFLKRTAVLSLLVAALACAGNNESDDTGSAALDTTGTISDSASTNQTESGITDSSGQSTLGSGVEQMRPDEGQPVTAKGDTLNTGVDSSTTPDSSNTPDSSTTPQ